MTGQVDFIVYSRRGCHLCELLLEELEPLLHGRAGLQVCDIDQNADWLAEYNERVPVVVCDGKLICQYNLDRQAVLDRIAAG